ncbi:bile acid:sodium symporter [Actinotalea sp. K2]|uniref:arsenic resistance protein n=1 Tax=Actinotalea sp. K2 TaxID=2939438 RepID=UPI002017B4EE|nr:bile acid:sodium symporter [Actinotalea sp. K2]MCL3861585.1 bile acid:sodium symporter [Actinotalea sp. K2]
MSGQLDRLTVERRQVWVYAGAIAVGLALGSVAPGLGAVAEVLLWPVLAVLLYSTFVQVPLLHLLAAARDLRFTGATVLGNFVILPLVVWAVVSFLPADPAIRLGVLLVLLVPCTDWFISFTQIARGDVSRAIAVTPVNLVLQLLLLPAYLLLMAREEVSGLVSVEVVAPALLIVVVPLIAAAVTERWVEARPERQVVRDRLSWAPVPLLACVVFLIATAQVETVRGSLDVLPVVVPVFVAFLVAAVITAKLLAVTLSLPPDQGRTLAFGLGTRNSFVVLPFALALPEGFEVVAVVIVVQSLVELLGMTFFVWWIPRVFRTDRRGRRP